MNGATSAFKRPFNALWTPSAAFSCLAEQPSILPAIFVQIVVLGIAMLILPTLPSPASDPSVPPEVLRAYVWADRAGAVYAAFVSPVLSALMLGVVAKFFGSFLPEAPNYKTYLSIVSHARIPLAVGTLVESVATAVTNHLGVHGYVTMDASILLPPQAPKYLTAALTPLNPFFVWYLVLLLIGFCTVHKAKPIRGLPLVCAVFIAHFLTSLPSA